MAHCISQRRDSELSAGNTLVSKVAGLPTFNLKGRRRVLLQARFATLQRRGTFRKLPDDGIVTINGNNLQANYEGGDGNDLTLTVVP
jgi:hypothetical protein